MTAMTLTEKILACHAGDYARTRQAIERQFELTDRLSSRRDQVDVLTSASGLRSDEGRFREALEIAERAFDMATGLSPHERMHASFAVMLAAEAIGEWDRVVEVLAWHAENAALEPDVSCTQVRGGPPLGATVLWWRGEEERARTLVPVDDAARWRDTFTDRALTARYAALVGRDDVATAIAESVSHDPDRLLYPDALGVLMEALETLGRRDEVIRFVPVLRSFASVDAVLGPIADRAEARLAIEEGKTDDARPLASAALARFQELEMPFESARTQQLLASVSHGEERSALLRAALASFERLGARPFADEVRVLLDGRPVGRSV